VIIVLGLLAALVGPRMSWQGLRSEERDGAHARSPYSALRSTNYRLDNGSYPTTEQGLDALQEKTRARTCAGSTGADPI